MTERDRERARDRDRERDRERETESEREALTAFLPLLPLNVSACKDTREFFVCFVN